ncbi:MAG TPA: hypothetical protein P5270_02615 [Victivallales bacterium]|nr:hypothetical protein [Victivallales bacterium]HRR28230.1 hypothetical protein [Victivallales bacterium]HRU00098.1 hypothetical protein [Victivallales bacterium]
MMQISYRKILIFSFFILYNYIYVFAQEKLNQQSPDLENIKEQNNSKNEQIIEFFHDAKWFSKECGALQVELQKDEMGGTSAIFANSSSILVYLEKQRNTFRPNRYVFNKKFLNFDVTFESEQTEPIKCCIFLKNSDGLWYQSRTIFNVKPGIKQTLSVDTSTKSMELQPEGHYSVWNCLDKATTISYGIHIFDSLSRKIKVSISQPYFRDEIQESELFINNLDFPENVEQNSTFEAKFSLSKDYFNPFDPDEISVDAIIVQPNFKEIKRPAFFTREYQSSINLNLQIRTPYGAPYWAFRFVPESPGIYKFKIIAKDKDLSIESSWRSFTSIESNRPGFIRVCENDKRYFEFTNGKFFYPIGFNIHSVKDVRSEKKLNLGYIPDRGIYAYQEYFDAMAANNLNSVEIWMAAWSFAIEWTFARTDYYGLGRYNLYNAWRLDNVLSYAREKDIKIHLVLDNHGKLSSHCDPEWNDSPHNKNRDFAIADNAMLSHPSEFFYNQEAENYYLKRNRYIAARWGADPNIFGIEFWSEIDLITDIKKTYDDNTSVNWHKKMSEQLDSFGIRNLLTTHTCGDYNHPITYRKYYEEIPLISYIVGDAYRDHTPIVEHMKRHTQTLKFFNKPLLITEYGGSPQGAAFNKLEADLHGGIWASFFLEQAGTPFLWWHDFIHDKNKYKHFYGFSKFISDIDPRNKNFRFREISIFNVTDNTNSPDLGCLAAGNQKEHYAWIYQKNYMEFYPSKPEEEPDIKNKKVSFETMMPSSKYRIDFFDTLTGQLIISQLIPTDNSGFLSINIPDFKVDVALKIRLNE